MPLRALGDQHRLRQVRRVDDDELRVGGRAPATTTRTIRSRSDGTWLPPAQNRARHVGATYAGSSRSLVRYTFTRCPSRIVIVGSRFRNRFMTCSARLRRRVADAAGDDDRAVAVAAAEARAAEELRQAADQPDRRRGAERRQ